MEFLRQEYWSQVPFPSPGHLPDSGIELISPASQVYSLPLSHQGSQKQPQQKLIFKNPHLRPFLSTPWPGDPPGIACDTPGHILCSAEITFSSVTQTGLETPGKQGLCLVHGSSGEHTLNRCTLEE